MPFPYLNQDNPKILRDTSIDPNGQRVQIGE